VGMRAPRVEGSKGETVCRCGVSLELADVLQCVRLQMAYHLNARSRFICYRGLKKDGSWGNWSLGRFVKKPSAACKKCGDSCLHVVIDDFGDIDACVWCKARLVGCSIAQR
jgi:hypothetical protein